MAAYAFGGRPLALKPVLALAAYRSDMIFCVVHLRAKHPRHNAL